MSRIRLTWGLGCLLFAMAVNSAGAEEACWLEDPFAGPPSWQPEGFILPPLEWEEDPWRIQRGQMPGAGAWQRISDGTRSFSRGTRDFFSRTYDALTPWETENQRRRRQAAQRSGRRPEPRSIWSRLFVPEPEPRPPQTVSEWLSQPRP